MDAWDTATTGTAVAERPAPAGWRAGVGPRLEGQTWVILLAGGEGRRLRAFTTSEDGAVVPKQFCRFRDERTLFRATFDRARRLVPKERVLAVVLDGHRIWWEPDVASIPPLNVISQPANRGTAVAILRALVEIHLRDRKPRVVVMPCDHEVDDEGAWIRSIRRAEVAAARHPDELVLLGVVPSHLDCEYGFVVPGDGDPREARRVRTFVEKPSLTLGSRLIGDGALWNCFLFAGTGAALYALYEEALPALVRGYLQGMVCARENRDALGMLFDVLPDNDFSRDVLERSPGRLRVLASRACGWTDLGTPARLAVWLDSHREAPFWMNHRLPRLPIGTGTRFGALEPRGV
jgi:mannose-1-phosphate guanylyltransferase